MVRYGVITLFSLIVGLVGAELLMRWLLPDSFLAKYLVPHPVLGYRFLKNVQAKHYWNGRFFEIRTNNMRLRQDESISINKAEDEHRILVLGDSFAFGWGVDIEETFFHLIQEKVRESFPGKKIQLLNAGHGGFGTQEMLYYLREYGEAFQPDSVVLFMGPNDVDDNVRSSIYHFPKQGPTTLNENIQSRLKRKWAWLEDMLFTSVVHQVVRGPINVNIARLKKWRENRAKASVQTSRQPVATSTAPKTATKPAKKPFPYNEAFRRTRMLIQEVAQWARERNLPLVISSIGKSGPETGRFLKAHPKWFAEQRIAFIDVTPEMEIAYIKNGGWGNFLIKDDMHFNPRGHRLFFDLVWPKLMVQWKEQLVPAGPTT